jgi:hypothetical protein
MLKLKLKAYLKIWRCEFGVTGSLRPHVAAVAVTAAPLTVAERAR